MKKAHVTTDGYTDSLIELFEASIYRLNTSVTVFIVVLLAVSVVLVVVAVGAAIGIMITNIVAGKRVSKSAT